MMRFASTFPPLKQEETKFPVFGLMSYFSLRCGRNSRLEQRRNGLGTGKKRLFVGKKQRAARSASPLRSILFPFHSHPIFLAANRPPVLSLLPFAPFLRKTGTMKRSTTPSGRTPRLCCGR
jgi:hypothetical protein